MNYYATCVFLTRETFTIKYIVKCYILCVLLVFWPKRPKVDVMSNIFSYQKDFQTIQQLGTLTDIKNIANCTKIDYNCNVFNKGLGNVFL